MTFDSKNFNREKINQLTNLATHVKNNEQDSLFLGFAFLLFKVIDCSSQGRYSYSETFYHIEKNDLKNLKKIKKEFEVLNYTFTVKVARKAKRFTITILWN